MFFCDQSFQQVEIAKWEPESGGTSFFVMLALNILVSVVSASALRTSMKHQQERETYRHRSHLTQEDWELVAKRFMKHDKTIPADVNAQIDLEAETRSLQPLSVIFSNNPRVKVPYKKDFFKQREFDPLERFRIPH
jgi:hypothetical protein